MTTLESIMRDRAELGMADLLLTIFDYAYCLGGNLAPRIDHAGMDDLLSTLEARHRTEILAARGWVDPVEPQDIAALPGWLLRLSRQADVIEPPPVEGWPV